MEKLHENEVKNLAQETKTSSTDHISSIFKRPKIKSSSLNKAYLGKTSTPACSNAVNGVSGGPPKNAQAPGRIDGSISPSTNAGSNNSTPKSASASLAAAVPEVIDDSARLNTVDHASPTTGVKHASSVGHTAAHNKVRLSIKLSTSGNVSGAGTPKAVTSNTNPWAVRSAERLSSNTTTNRTASPESIDTQIENKKGATSLYASAAAAAARHSTSAALASYAGTIYDSSGNVIKGLENPSSLSASSNQSQDGLSNVDAKSVQALAVSASSSSSRLHQTEKNQDTQSKENTTTQNKNDTASGCEEVSPTRLPSPTSVRRASHFSEGKWDEIDDEDDDDWGSTIEFEDGTTVVIDAKTRKYEPLKTPEHEKPEPEPSSSHSQSASHTFSSTYTSSDINASETPKPDLVDNAPTNSELLSDEIPIASSGPTEQASGEIRGRSIEKLDYSKSTLEKEPDAPQDTVASFESEEATKVVEQPTSDLDQSASSPSIAVNTLREEQQRVMSEARQKAVERRRQEDEQLAQSRERARKKAEEIRLVTESREPGSPLDTSNVNDVKDDQVSPTLLNVQQKQDDVDFSSWRDNDQPIPPVQPIMNLEKSGNLRSSVGSDENATRHSKSRSIDEVILSIKDVIFDNNLYKQRTFQSGTSQLPVRPHQEQLSSSRYSSAVTSPYSDKMKSSFDSNNVLHNRPHGTAKISRPRGDVILNIRFPYSNPTRKLSTRSLRLEELKPLEEKVPVFRSSSKQPLRIHPSQPFRVTVSLPGEKAVQVLRRSFRNTMNPNHYDPHRRERIDTGFWRSAA
ncbi:Schizosaccharomyces specific phosphoprotein [Schizosaccharomyces osmophilus]|uniref:Schizosaccharomyces specific phosphoprotein n=1 Tax=Schizosaccharomyces osmophilus TaxID=2545709 RepID=A0AAE9W7P7_9SCHI|nr:Schizosaccharomyces specific phosphoprotein [Schizosaccharomyces osmophilus]WBW71381.1 Schizosaccharomyces specific phosphoprotein [Schizosaccharomyces osmophilus]